MLLSDALLPPTWLQAFALDMEELQLQAWGPNADDLYACGMHIMDIDSRVGLAGE